MKKKKTVKKLVLAKETVKNLEAASLAEVAAGAPSQIVFTCNGTYCECPPWW